MCQYQPAIVCKQSLVERDRYRLSSHHGAFKRWQKVLHLACTHAQHLSDLSQFHPPRPTLSAHICCLLVCACACHIKNNEIPILSFYQCSPSPKTSPRSDGVQRDIEIVTRRGHVVVVVKCQSMTAPVTYTHRPRAITSRQWRQVTWPISRSVHLQHTVQPNRSADSARCVSHVSVI